MSVVTFLAAALLVSAGPLLVNRPNFEEPTSPFRHSQDFFQHLHRFSSGKMTDPDERGGGQELVALKELLGGSDVGLVKIVNDGSEKKQSDVSSGGGSSNGSSYEVAMQVDNSGPVLKNGRLPRTIKPVRYDLTVAPDLEASRLAGIVVIDTECLGGTNELWLHSDPAIVWEGVAVTREGTEIDGGDKDGETISGVTSFPVDQVVRVTLKRELAEGTSVQITVKFSATFSDKLVGFYKARYMEDNVIKSIGVTHLWPTEARRMLPCFDEPGLKAPFTVRMQRPVGLTALSNMPVKNTEPVAVSLLGQTENIVQDNFQETPNMSTYLLAMVLSDFANVNASDGTSKSQGPLVRVWMPPALAAQGRFAASISPPILKFYESLFDIPYPLPKMDLFVAPDLAYGAMENWGLITYRAQRLLFDPRVSTANDQVEIASTIAHEISHQWFGNLVTPNWWTDLWLNEGFASYMEVVPIQDLFPHWKAGEIIYSEKLRGVLVTDSLRASHPISKEGVTTTDEIMELFDDISYRKGSSLIRMIVSMMGQDAFFDALSKYLKKFIYGNASQDDLWHYLTLADVALREAGEGSRLPDGVGLKEIMDSWTLQTGYPVVTVSRANPEEQEDGGERLKFFQSRFFLHPVGPNDLTFDEKAASKWWIPLNFAKGNLHDELGNVRYFGTDAPISWSDSRPHGWLDPSGDYGSVVEPREPPTVKTGDWVIVNVGHTGYYRVNYDETNWRLLAAALREDHTAISVVNRAQLVDDVLMLARAGYVEYDIAFDVLSYLEKEREYLPWSAALENFRFLMNMLTKDGDGGDDEILKKYLSTLIAPALSELKLDEPDGRQVAKPRLKKASESPVSEVPDVHEDLNSIWYRSLLLKWGCKLGDERILSDANDIFRKWMRAYDPDHPDEPTVLKPNDKETVYCYGIKQGGKAVWEFAVAHLVRTTVASERELLLSALACSDDAEVIRSFMDAIIQSVSGASYVDHADAITALLSVAASSYHGREHLMNLITNDWEEVRGLFGPGRKNVGRVFVQISRAVSSEKTLELIEEFAEKNSDALHGAGLLMQTARELLSANIRWQKEFREKFVEAVKNRTL